ncbi:hypothetical protein [Ignatzschineria cameli]|uniref:Uncharacterized protein n=1 Tax=Ignatzschineria cameli TaxID=2182793 RepID=A0A2U2AJG3_9GAMM|nr:hypothetical protein [Ignatzschineria cameli]PWD82829.1 hypothetical protein DC080_09850 [Ignatzschineria cameli]PWD82877.1 hypothetical protein DC077_10350 [Ignatzschineria cameli]PWD87643.1 hypothetical protein DC079_10445 [Ignatzschineria cameli]PWD88811.1 hypothetical protein DC078_10565 [Ignatzschineria cameli]PWD90226.1 hypothetical protein DC081_07470 [Ignatzschineria cameli]
MSQQLYINGKPASLLQRILAAVIGIGALIVFAFFGLAVFVIGLGVTAVLAVIFFWKTRKIRKQVREEMARMQEEGGGNFSQFYGQQPSRAKEQKKGELYEGEYKEL